MKRKLHYRRAATEWWPTVQHRAADTAEWLEELQRRFSMVAKLLSRSNGYDTTTLKQLLSRINSIEEELESVLNRNFYELGLAFEQHLEELETDEELY